jgi:hypothetical protein
VTACALSKASRMPTSERYIYVFDIIKIIDIEACQADCLKADNKRRSVNGCPNVTNIVSVVAKC